MAFYDYKCVNCNKIFEISKGMNDTVIGLKCPKCKSPDVKRMFTGIRMKRGEASLLNTFGTSGGACDTCVDGACSSCGSRN